MRARAASSCRSRPIRRTSTRISADEQVPMPGSPDIERRIKSLVRWNALAMVVRANKAEEGIGGHISTYASAATLYEVAFNHFFRGSDGDRDGDVVFFQGHASPGIYARAYLEGRIDETHLGNFRRELDRRRRPLVLPASVADAGLLGIPDRLDGARPDHGDLPCAVHPLHGGSRADAEVRRQGLGVSRRRRDRRAGNARRDHAAVAREARQPHLRHQLQPAAARRSGPRQRADHPGARGDVPRRRLERHQGASGAASGTRCSPRIATACW